MAYRLPTFNLEVGIWHDPHLPGVDPEDDIVIGQLRWMGRGPAETVNTLDNASWQFGATLLVPAGTDLRDHYVLGAPRPDVVEVPIGTGRFYFVAYVDDVARGFPNEYRFACLFKRADLLWPIPIP